MRNILTTAIIILSGGIIASTWYFVGEGVIDFWLLGVIVGGIVGALIGPTVRASHITGGWGAAGAGVGLLLMGFFELTRIMGDMQANAALLTPGGSDLLGNLTVAALGRIAQVAGGGAILAMAFVALDMVVLGGLLGGFVGTAVSGIITIMASQQGLSLNRAAFVLLVGAVTAVIVAGVNSQRS